MEVKGRLITSMGVGSPDQDSKLQAERISALQERKQILEDILSSRMGELRQVCLLEAELTGMVPHAFPLETGERAPVVQRRAGLAHNNTKGEDETGQRRQMKTLFSGALYRHSESDRNVPNSRRTVHRGCHTEDTVMSESTSSMSDSTSHDNEESSPSVAEDHRSMSQPRLGSPDHQVCRKLSPVEIYYEMRTRRNSVTSSISPSHSLPRSGSNVEGRSVPATPLLARTAPISVHVRSDDSGGISLKQWSGSLDVPHMEPLAQEGSFSEHRGCPYSSSARRSNSSEALLDRSSLPEDPAPRNGMPPRGGPYKSSEALTDGKLRHIHLGSPERQEHANLRLSMGGRGEAAEGESYNELLMDYIWGKQQRMQVQNQLYQSTGRIWQDISSPRSSTAAVPPHANGFSHSQVHLPSAAPSYSPRVIRSSQAEPRRVKVTRTKSCGPFIPLQQDAILLSAYESPHPDSSSTTSSIPNLHPFQTELSGPSFNRRPPQFSLPTPEDSTRSLHKALALEGLRDWYLRNALGYPTTTSKGLDAGVSRLSHPHPLVHQAHSIQGDPLHRSQMSQSASFHGHPLHGRSMEFSLYQEPIHPQMQDMTPKEPSADPGTLV